MSGIVSGGADEYESDEYAGREWQYDLGVVLGPYFRPEQGMFLHFLAHETDPETGEVPHDLDLHDFAREACNIRYPETTVERALLYARWAPFQILRRAGDSYRFDVERIKVLVEQRKAER